VQFLTDFDICPNLITKHNALYLFHFVVHIGYLENKKWAVLGRCCTFAKFIELILLIGYHCKIGCDVMKEKYYSYLTKIELSKKYQKMFKEPLLPTNKEIK